MRVVDGVGIGVCDTVTSESGVADGEAVAVSEGVAIVGCVVGAGVACGPPTHPEKRATRRTIINIVDFDFIADLQCQLQC